jgi:NTE family protein
MCGQDLRTGVFLKYLDPRVAFRLLGRETSITDELARAYAEDFGLDWSLESLPSSPRFVICAANLETGKLWTFGRWPETRDSVVNDDVLMGDYIYGWERAGDVSVASAVAASSAFPIAFPPLVLETPSRDVRARYVSLTDGGVYDNLGLEPLWKFKEGATHDVILVSDAGMPMTLMDDPRSGLTTRLIRSNAVIMDQALAVRKRWLIDRFTSTKTRGAYWGIGSEHTAYGLTRSEGFLGSALSRLAAVRTDLDAFSADERFCLVNHGYAIADAGLRRWVLGGRDADMMDFRWPHPTHTNPADVIGWLEESGERGLLDDMVRAFRGRRS